MKLIKGKKKILIQTAAVAVILTVGLIVSKVLTSAQKSPELEETQPLAPLVNAQTIRKESLQMIIQGYGTVQPKVSVQIVPQVSGEVIALDENFVNGGFFAANQTLVEIDPADYELAVQRTQAQQARAQVALDLEKAQGYVSRQEWQELNPDQAPPSDLVFREPQIRQAKAELQAARAQLATAQLDLERTKISLPFNGRIINESVDIGQYLTGGQPIASVYGTDTVEIPVPLEDSELAWFDIDENNVVNNNSNQTESANVIVSAQFAGKTHKWAGKIIRTEGQVDPTSRMVNVVVEVKNPFKTSNGKVALVPGMFAEVSIMGRTLKNLSKVPRHAVHNGNQVWIAEEDRLLIRQVEIARYDKESAYILSGLDDQAIIIVSPLDTVTNQMKIRTNIIPDK